MVLDEGELDNDDIFIGEGEDENVEGVDPETAALEAELDDLDESDSDNFDELEAEMDDL